LKSKITLYENNFIEKLRTIEGAGAEVGFLAQYIDSDELETFPFFALQPSKETNSHLSNKSNSTTQNYDLVVAVKAGEGQSERLADALFDMRSTLFKNVLLPHLGEERTEGQFKVDEAEFFVPEGFEQFYCASLPVTIQYTDTF